MLPGWAPALLVASLLLTATALPVPVSHLSAPTQGDTDTRLLAPRVSRLALADDDDAVESSQLSPILANLRFGRSSQSDDALSLMPRNDRFFLQRYGKRSALTVHQRDTINTRAHATPNHWDEIGQTSRLGQLLGQTRPGQTDLSHSAQRELGPTDAARVGQWLCDSVMVSDGTRRVVLSCRRRHAHAAGEGESSKVTRGTSESVTDWSSFEDSRWP